MTAGGSNPRVVKVGNTIRRPIRPWSDSVRDLLLYLEQVGFPYSPRYLGIDNQGREVLSYIEGMVAAIQPWPEWVWRDETLRELIGIVGDYHCAVSDYQPSSDARWRFATGSCPGGEIVCHNDIGPPNVVFSKSGAIVGLIDWETVAPAPASNDIAHVAWWWVPLVHPAVAARVGTPAASDLAARLRLVSDSFGLDAADLVAIVRDYIQVRVDHAQRGVSEGDEAFLALERRGYLVDLVATLEYLSDWK